MESAQREASGGGASSALDKSADGAVFKDLALDLIHESPTNPRKTFEQAKLLELAQSLRASGMIVRMLVRPSKIQQGKYECVDGARRFRAAKLAGLATGPAEIREMTDEQVLEAQLVSALQREGLDEMEEAEGYRKLMDLTKAKVEDIAKRVGKGKSVEYIYGRLKLLQAMPEVKQALKKGDITAGHAVLIARLDAVEQGRALDECFEGLSVRELDAWIEREIRQPAAQRELVAKNRADLVANKTEFVEVSSRFDSRAPKGALKNGEYEVVPQSATGPTVKTALFVDGPKTGEMVKVKVLEKRPTRPATKAHDWQADQAKREEKRKREVAIRRAILAAALESVKAPLEVADLRFALEGFLGRDANAGELATMKPQRLGHLLIELSLDSEVEAWVADRKPERLLAFAKAHKVNAEKVRARVEAELKKGPAEKKLEDMGLLPKAQTSAKPKTAKAGAR